MKSHKKGLLITITLILCACLFYGGRVYTEDSKDYPFFPSLLNVKDGRPVKSSEFTSPQECSTCHADIHTQWKGSMHSNAFQDPVFQALWKLGSKETNGLVDKLCAGCHTSIGTITEELAFDKEKNVFEVSPIAKQGVQCDFCHSVIGSTFLNTPTHEPENGSLLVDPGEIKRGPYKDAESPFHKTAYSEIHTKSEFCGSCHHVFHPVTNFPIERTYDEWKHSVYARNDIQCQDCHMMPVEKAIEAAKTLKKQQNPGKAVENGPDRENVYTHEFVGSNFTITTLMGAEKHAEMAKKRLQSAAEVKIIAPDSLQANNIGTIEVQVTNVGAGHNLPTSLTEVRQMWLNVNVTDANNTTLFSSGELDKDYNIDPEAVIFQAYAVDDKGNHTVKPWEIARFESNNTIPPKGSAVEKYSFFVPKDVKGPVKVSVKLRYRSYPQAVANLLLGSGAPVLPIVDMNVVETSIKL